MPQFAIWDVTLPPAPPTPRLRRPPAPRLLPPPPGTRLVDRFERALANVHDWLEYLEGKPVHGPHPLGREREIDLYYTFRLVMRALSRERGLAALSWVTGRSTQLTYDDARMLLLVALDRLLSLHRRHVERGKPDFLSAPEETPRRLLRPRRPPPPRRIVRPPVVRQPPVRPLPPPELPDNPRIERTMVRSRGLASDFDPANYPPPWLRAMLPR